MSGFGGNVKYDVTNQGYILGFTQNDSLSGKTIQAFRIKYDDWIKFQKVITSLHVKEWKANYHYDMFDGWDWSLTIYTNSKVYSSQGDNAGPSPRDPSLILHGLEGIQSSEFILNAALTDLYRASKK